MTRLMCSQDEKSLGALRERLSSAGIRSEIRCNPIARDLGITRLEVFVARADFTRASKIRRDFDRSPHPDGSARMRDISPRPGKGSQPTAQVGPFQLASSAPPQESGPEREHEVEVIEPERESTRGKTLLSKQIEELLTRESKLTDYCSVLEQKMHSLQEALTDAQVGLAREMEHRSNTERALADLAEVRTLLAKQTQKLDLYFKAFEKCMSLLKPGSGH